MAGMDGLERRRPNGGIRVSITDAARTGGLAVALSECLKTTGGVWFGWSGEVSEWPGTRPRREVHGGVTAATVPSA